VNLFLRPAAVADIHAASKYYEEVRPGLGEELADDLDHLFTRLLAFPLSARIVAGYEPVRRARLRRFPYQVFYRPDDDRTDILRIVHTARSPETWRTETTLSE
jgi:toxin ParE1/3/4